MSDLVKRLAGTLIAENEKSPVIEWLQEQLRAGSLRPLVARFVRGQAEALDGEQVQVDEVTASVVRCRIPYFVRDHENSKPLRVDVELDLNPLSGQVLRRDG